MKTTGEIVQLRKKRKELCSTLQFDDARVTSSTMKEMKNQEIQSLIEENKELLGEKIQILVQQFEENIQGNNSEIDEQEMLLRQKTDIAFQEIQQNQLFELISLEKKYVLDILRSKKRKYRDQLILVKQAVDLALIEEYDSAKITKKKADKSFNNDVEKARYLIDKTYSANRKSLYDKQRTELSILNEKLRTGLQNFEVMREHARKSEEKQLKVQIIDTLESLLDSLPEEIKAPRIKAQFTKELSDYAQSHLDHIGLILQPSRGPLKYPLKYPDMKLIENKSVEYTPKAPKVSTSPYLIKKSLTPKK